MIGAGHPADFLLRATVRTINGAHNVSTSPSRTRSDDPKFGRVVEAIRAIEQAGALGVRIERSEEQVFAFIVFQRNMGDDTERDIRLAKETLGIDADIDELRLVSGTARRRPNEIALLTRSIQELMGELATGIDVPERDLLDGRATSRTQSATGGLMRILSGSERPPDAFAAVRYRANWFWIDDRDLGSKRTFMFLMIFSSLAESGALPHAPVLTIPAR